MNKLEGVLKYKDYPEGSGGKKIYDSYILSFDVFLTKYYSKINLSRWDEWMEKYVKLAFNQEQHEEMAKNFGYVSVSMHSFEEQQKIYDELETELRLDQEVRMFIGFMAGAGFFKRYNLNIEQWFHITNWMHPHQKDVTFPKLNVILNYPYGLNYIKVNLLQLPFWQR